jgi:transposase InsO family protein
VLIHHWDHGNQYASRHYQRLLKTHGRGGSMSRKGNGWDNAPVERFLSSLKREWIGDRLYGTRQDAINDVRAYIMMYYNTRRLHSILGYPSPAQYEQQAQTA